MSTRLIVSLLFLSVVAGALALRLPRLGLRPMHADEAVQAHRLGELWQEGRYQYDPDEFHGPTLIYATLPSAWLGGAATYAETDEATYRVVPVVFGCIMILAIWLLRDALGAWGATAAAALAALSPAMVFYSRYYIHETLLACFTLAAIGCAWRYVRTGRAAWCLGAGACVGLMQATKETAVLSYAAAAVALAATWIWQRAARRKPKEARARVRVGHLLAAAAVALMVWAVLMSSFFTNPRGPLDGVLTYLPWTTRALSPTHGVSPHAQPWFFYLQRLASWKLADGPRWSEGLVLGLACAGLGVAFFGRRSWLPGGSLPFLRWLGLYTLLLTAAYTAIPYKTPWCLLQFLLGMVLLAGAGAATLVRLVPTLPLKGIVALVLLFGAGHLGWQAVRASYVLPADPRNPYVYAHTSARIGGLAGVLAELGEAMPGKAKEVKVVWRDTYYWPLPWYLRRFERCGYWTRVPDEPAAPIVIASPEHDAALTEKLDATHLMTGFYEIRPGVLAMLWVRMDVWEAHLRRQGAIP